MHKKALHEIASIVGKDNLLTAKEELMCYSYDATNQKFLPEAVVFALNPQQISEIMLLANQYLFPVIPRGAGSGFVGGSLPVEGGLVLVLTKMNKIIKIEPENLTAVVEPGVITGDFQQKVESLGLFYPPDPASLKISTMGGNVAVCSGGPRCLKYGVTKNYVLGLELVLPTGEIIGTGVQTLKGVAGYDLTSLFVGSEGTLGIITKITVKLLPLPENKKTLLAIFPHLDDAARTVSSIIQARIIPATLELIDQAAIRCVEDYLNMGLPTQAEALLLIEVDGDSDTVTRQNERIKDICLKNGAGEVKIAHNSEEEEQLWKARRSISPALLRLNPHKVNEDINVPISQIPEIIRRINKIAKKHQLINVNFGHAGDGNIHTNFMINKDNPDEV
ncbi:MAG: FAD-binding protein, partial [Deltaproteobacteria bacterium]|nr:FAD-binding protein [Deltaproteobacteria bacterium]